MNKNYIKTKRGNIMSTKERIYQLIDSFSDEQLKGLLVMLTGYSEIVAEAQDDAYCAKLYQEAQADDDSETKSIEDFAEELGIKIV